MEIQEILAKLGLKDREISIYLSLLEFGEGTVLEISQHSRVKRPTTYLVLNSLASKGMVSRVLKKNKTFYIAEHPRKLITEAELRLQEIKQTVPSLETLIGQQNDKPKIMIYEGKDNLDRAYDESFVAGGEVLYMSTIKFSLELFPKTIRKLKYSDSLKDFRTRELVDMSQEGKQYQKDSQNQNRQVRFIPKEFMPFDVDIGIFGKRVLITSVKKEYFTLSIESSEINQAFRVLFEGLWRISENT